MTDFLKAEAITKQFGGVLALDQVTLDVRRGEIHGLIGPNGSGKTTLLNLLSGYYPLDAGRILLGERDISRLGARDRAALRIARTFQTPRLLRSLTVRENAMLGGWRFVESSLLATAMCSPRMRREERMLRARATQVLEGIGLAHLADRRADVLGHAEQRFLEIARGLVMSPDFLLLDEPAGGLTSHEMDLLGQVMRTIRDAGIGLLLVEHHTDFVFGICDRVTTLNLGRLIAAGTPAAVRRDPEVIKVYLGA
jgi:branched-chain amino acid transport system ATP-binding protein